ncbi:MAG: hypothetical protein DRP42_00235 [Tenericutes bacterium]|nr:MAG: hypothetical protein DRP42_00235 [Mycoplasmatota bacterium]
MLNYLNGEHDKKASVIFPVAGPQTQTALQSILDNSPTSQVIGVDVDAVPASPEYSNNILGSATKNLGQSMEYAT